MSKAEELANSVEMHIPCRRALGHGESCITGRLCDSCERTTHLAAHLRALEASRQMLVVALGKCSVHIAATRGNSDEYAILGFAALEQAKEMT